MRGEKEPTTELRATFMCFCVINFKQERMKFSVTT
jgi:hypothetical protein